MPRKKLQLVQEPIEPPHMNAESIDSGCAQGVEVTESLVEIFVGNLWLERLGLPAARLHAGCKEERSVWSSQAKQT
jgi:hypothetical protein